MILIIQNDPDVPPGLLAEVLAAERVPFTITAAWEAQYLHLPDETSGLIVLGGAMGVHETEKHPFLRAVMQVMGEALRRQIPMLGICLGGQLLAKLLGAAVIPSSGCGERGILPVALSATADDDPLFSGLPPRLITFQWHDDSFTLPPGATRIASSPVCPVQAFRVGRAWGLQFHPEVTPEIISCWSSAETPAACSLLLASYAHEEVPYRAAAAHLFIRFSRLTCSFSH